MKKHTLGASDIEVGIVGLGCMGMSEFYGATDEAQSIKTIHRAIELGVDHFDTADMYGVGRNEQLVKKALVDSGKRDSVTIATKFGVQRTPEGDWLGVNGKPEYVREACEASLKRLGIETIDLYYLHRVDPNTPIEETVEEMKKLVEEGKVRHIGLSEASADNIRRAHAIHPITALQSEYALSVRDVEGETLDTCRELGISVVAFSPLGRGLLTGKITNTTELAEDDFRRAGNGRFQGDDFSNNLKQVEALKEIAAAKQITLAQLALAWVFAQGDDIVSIPGTKRIKYLEENVKATEVSLTPDELEHIREIGGRITGNR